VQDTTIKRLRATLPPLLKIQQYCDLTHRSIASAYNDLRNTPGLAVKVGGSTRILLDRVLDEMAHAAWVPQKDRAGSPAAKSSKHKSRRSRAQQREPGARP
jgi:hypothetical protein